ncbi:MAG: type II toxin-antitoxin system prevent-host-death family antitoxin [Puniceicoccaceae bacterium]|nr:MAG: type II toxin-antitoxin system prevent-host-death family antitoxin [Puniceicoccaceae bacterium]
MTTININEAKTHLSRYAKRVKAGETVILADRNKPFAEIRPLPTLNSAKKRILGQLTGKVQFDDTSNHAFGEADAEIEADFLRSEIFPLELDR